MEEEHSMLVAPSFSPDQVLNKIGESSNYLLGVVSCASLAWAVAALVCMTSSFYDTIPVNGTFETPSVEFNLTGDMEYLREVTASSFMVGNMFGGGIVAPISDRVGRRPVLLACALFSGLTTLFASYSPSLTVFILARGLQGIFYTGSAQCSWVVGYEHCPASLRPTSTFIYGMTWVIGYCAVAPIAYLSTTWRQLLLFASLPCFFLAIMLYFFVPESIHYLVKEGKEKKIGKWLEKAQKKNSEDDHVVHGDIEKMEAREGLNVISMMIEYKVFLLYAAIMSCLWISDTFVYFGLSFYSTSLAGNMYLNYIILGLVEIPAYVVTPELLKRFSRKAVVVGTHLMSALAFVFLMLIPDNTWLSLAGWVIGKFAISIAFMATYVLGSEVFPTELRNGAIGACEVLSRIGGILAPYVTTLGRHSKFLPLLAFAVVATVGGLSTILLPETKHRPLPTSIEQSVKADQ